MEPSKTQNKWFVINAKVRIDSFNQNSLREGLKRARSLGYSQIAVDVTSTRFISLAAIQSMVRFGKELKAAGGEFVLIGPTEKTKRHFEIYGSLDSIKMARVPFFAAAEKVDLTNDSSPKSDHDIEY